MLEVGNGGMSIEEYKTHFSLWAALKSPLILGNNLANMTEDVKSIITNKEIIDINQDLLGIPAFLVERITESNFFALYYSFKYDIWTGPLSKGNQVAILFNRDTKVQDICLNFQKHLNALPDASFDIRDLWLHKTMKKQKSYCAQKIPSNGVVVLKIFGIQTFEESHKEIHIEL
jgi:alpha-galactosidase